MAEKKDGALVAHVPKQVEMQVKRLAEHDGFTPSEYVTNLIMADLHTKREWFDFMKSLFDGEK